MQPTFLAGEDNPFAMGDQEINWRVKKFSPLYVDALNEKYKKMGSWTKIYETMFADMLNETLCNSSIKNPFDVNLVLANSIAYIRHIHKDDPEQLAELDRSEKNVYTAFKEKIDSIAYSSRNVHWRMMSGFAAKHNLTEWMEASVTKYAQDVKNYVTYATDKAYPTNKAHATIIAAGDVVKFMKYCGVEEAQKHIDFPSFWRSVGEQWAHLELSNLEKPREMCSGNMWIPMLKRTLEEDCPDFIAEYVHQGRVNVLKDYPHHWGIVAKEALELTMERGTYPDFATSEIAALLKYVPLETAQRYFDVVQYLQDCGRECVEAKIRLNERNDLKGQLYSNEDMRSAKSDETFIATLKNMAASSEFARENINEGIALAREEKQIEFADIERQ